MLQIITGKFFTSDNLYITHHTVVFYTNYRMFREEFSTKVGLMKQASQWHDINTIIYEFDEKLEAASRDDSNGEIRPIGLVSVGYQDAANDFSSIVSLVLRITMTTDSELAERLMHSSRPSPNVSYPASNYIDRYFEKEIIINENDEIILNDIIDKLIGLPRAKYEIVIKSIRRFITGTRRVGDDLELAYTLLVASIENLAQNFDGFSPEWENLDYGKRKDIDKAMDGIELQSVSKIRTSILKYEHLSLSRRFREFAKYYITPDFFRTEAIGIAFPIKESDLDLSLKNAYGLRSKYIHTLEDLPRYLTLISQKSESVDIFDGPTLTINGLSRLARTIIINYIMSQESIQEERFDYRSSLPGVVTMKISAEYWIWQPEGFDAKSSRSRLSGLIDNLLNCFTNKGSTLADMRKVCIIIEKISANTSKLDRIPMLIIYYLYNKYVNEDSQMSNWQNFVDRYENELDEPCIEILAANALVDQTSDWEPDATPEIWDGYLRQKYHKNGFKLSNLMESILLIRLTEQNRKRGYYNSYKYWLSESINNTPGNEKLIEIEKDESNWLKKELNYREILFPEKSQLQESG